MLLRAEISPPDAALDELWSATGALREVPGVRAVPRPDLRVPITAFGNLLPSDCTRLADKLRAALEGATAPMVRFHGLRFEGGATIMVGMDGEVDPIVDLATFVPEVAETLRLYVDRRRFRTAIELARAEPAASSAQLESALAPIAGWSGSPWSVPGLSLIRTRWLKGENRSELFDVIRFA